MKDNFIFAVGLGMLAGAILVYSCPQVKNMMKKGEKAIKNAETCLKESKSESGF